MKINLQFSEKNLSLDTYLFENGRLLILAINASNLFTKACFKILHLSLKQREVGSQGYFFFLIRTQR